MKRELIVWLAGILVVVTLSVNAFGVGGDMGAGTDPLIDGSAGHPFLIEDIGDFNAFSNDPNYWAGDVHTRLDTDIDLAGEVYSRAVIAPDYNHSNSYLFGGIPFEGIFDGNGHVIKNMVIEATGIGNDYLGLFGYIGDSNSEVKELGIKDFNIISEVNDVWHDYTWCIGGLCGYNSGTISNCYTTGNITVVNNAGDVGGLCGRNYAGGFINNCYSAGSVIGGDGCEFFGGLCGSNNFESTISNSYSSCIMRLEEINGSGTGMFGVVGGLCGGSWQDSDVNNCYATGAVSLHGDGGGVGGLCGLNADSSTINNCYSTGAASAYGRVGGVGGFCGSNVDFGSVYGGIINNCYSSGATSAYGQVHSTGGFCGSNSGDISDCYSTGAVSVEDTSSFVYLGEGFCGAGEDGTITTSFWDVETSGIGEFGDENYGARGNITDHLQMELLYTNWGWDFDPNDGDIADWWVNDLRDYPKLYWQPYGDLNNDSRVDMRDIAVMGLSWYSSDGDVNFNSVCELSGDWVIDEADLLELGVMWLAGPGWE